MTQPIDHILLTRFNLPSPGAESYIRAKEGWLRNRVELFEKYCLPSVLAQSNRNFHWIIYLDPESPLWLKERMEALHQQKVLTPIYREQVNAEERVSDLQAVSGASGQFLITTNLDNDDGLAFDFVDRMQSLAWSPGRTAIYFANGLIRHGSSLFAHRDTSNAFCSVRESWEEPISCWADWHNRLGLSMPVLILEGQPAWLQVVHGANVSNRVRGKRVASRPYAAIFGSLLEDTRDPNWRSSLRERTLDRPYRSLREGARSLIKNAILFTAGKEGLDRVKASRKTKIQALARHQ